MVTLRGGAVGTVGAVGGVAVAVDAFADGDAVSDGDLLRADEDVLDEQSQHALAFFDGGGLGVGVQLDEEALQVGGELEVGLCADVVSAGYPARCARPDHRGARLQRWRVACPAGVQRDRPPRSGPVLGRLYQPSVGGQPDRGRQERVGAPAGSRAVTDARHTRERYESSSEIRLRMTRPAAAGVSPAKPSFRSGKVRFLGGSRRGCLGRLLHRPWLACL
jgi:hypothetical protein